MDAEGGQPVGGYEGYDDEEEDGYPHHIGDYVDSGDGGDMIGDGVHVNGVVGDDGEDDDEGGDEGEEEGGEDDVEMNHGLNSFDIYAAADAVGMEEVGYDLYYTSF